MKESRSKAGGTGESRRHGGRGVEETAAGGCRRGRVVERVERIERLGEACQEGGGGGGAGMRGRT
jgi:hypothetical protein